MSLDSNDPRLTAYVLGELDDAERQEVESALETSEELRNEVEAIRAACDSVSKHLTEQPMPELSAEQRDTILQAAEQPSTPSSPGAGRWRRRLVLALSISAVLAVMAVGAWYASPELRQVAMSVVESENPRGIPEPSAPTEFPADAEDCGTDYGNDDGPELLITEGLASHGYEVDDDLDDPSKDNEASDPSESAFPTQPASPRTPTPPRPAHDSIEDVTRPGSNDGRAGRFGELGADESEANISGDWMDLAERGDPEGTDMDGPATPTGEVPSSNSAQGQSKMLLSLGARPASPETSVDGTEEEPQGERGKDRADKNADPPAAPPTTWRRTRAVPNASRLTVGEQDELALVGCQANVRIDGFRARVLVDYYYHNDRPQQLQGNFQLRLPDGASLYFFAFGETAFEYRPTEKNDLANLFVTAGRGSGTGMLPEEILGARADTWKAPKVARMVPREKAAHAYRETVHRRRVDPALVEWAGAGVFSAKVFPLLPQKLHRIVVGYDLDLTRIDDDLVYHLDLPEAEHVSADVNLATWQGGKAQVEPPVEPFVSNGRALYHVDSPSEQGLSIRLTDPGTTLLTGNDDKTGDYFATRIRPELPEVDASASRRGVFVLDTSLSANPDKFNVQLELLETILSANRDSMEEFAVLVFNIETFWWQERFVENTEENTKQLLAFANTLALEGATDLDEALREAARPGWFTPGDKNPPWDVFLLSDGAATWGDTNLAVTAAKLTSPESFAAAVFAYHTGMTGTDGSALAFLTRKTGGAVFTVVGEDQVDTAAVAHRKRPWQLDSITLDGATDVLVAGRPSSVYPGQELLVVGRGKPGDGAPLVLKLRRNGQKKKLELASDRTITSELAPRAYGQVAVGQLERFGEVTEDPAVAYARHFRVTGKTCSLLMLESEADYQRYDIKPENDAIVVRTAQTDLLLNRAEEKASEELVDPQLLFRRWLDRLEEMPGMKFRPTAAMRIAVDSLPAEAFEIKAKPLRIRGRTWDAVPEPLREALSTGKIDYDTINAEATRRLSRYGSPDDALKAVANLIENRPGDLPLLRDVAYSSLAWDLPGEAYPLLRRLVVARPYEPQAYLLAAGALESIGNVELAMLHYEVLLDTEWDGRFRDFPTIVRTEYVGLLRRIASGQRETRLSALAEARLEELGDTVPETIDLMVTMFWNTDATDVDLHVVEPGGEVCFYQHRDTKQGGHITQDCTGGFGPELYTLPTAKPGKYVMKAHYFASDRTRTGTRSKVYAIVRRHWCSDKESETRHAVTLLQGKKEHEITTIGGKQEPVE